MQVYSAQTPTATIERTPGRGRGAAALSIIRKVQIVQGGKEVPLDGGMILSQNVHVKPFFSEVYLNASLNNMVLGGSVRSNGLPRGHTDLNGGHPGLSKNLLEGILFSKVSPTSLRPEVVKNEATENV